MRTGADYSEELAEHIRFILSKQWSLIVPLQFDPDHFPFMHTGDVVLCFWNGFWPTHEAHIFRDIFTGAHVAGTAPTIVECIMNGSIIIRRDLIDGL